MSDETALERGQRITEEIMEAMLDRSDMSAQEMINAAAGVLCRYSRDELVVVCSYAMRYAVERAWDLRAAVRRD